MALAVLCSEVTNPESRIMAPLYELPNYRQTNVPLAAFIVDHKLRQNSGFEALRVAEELAKLGIEPRILEMDWQPYGDPHSLSNLESIARRLRYQALGKACLEQRVNSLLVAHHADDQAETVMTRVFNNYGGAGLGAIKATGNIPECAGIYGVDSSGSIPTDVVRETRKTNRLSRGLLREQGGVKVCRPLLPFSKQQLVAICQEKGIQWFEDRTNADSTLTIRNTVRFMNNGTLLPAPLRTHCLAGLAERVSRQRYEVEEKARINFDANIVHLSTVSGTAEYDIVKGFHEKTTDGADARSAAKYHVAAATLRRMLRAVSPKRSISLQDLDQAVVFVSDKKCAAAHTTKVHSVHVAGVSLQRKPRSDAPTSADARSKFVFHRCLPTTTEREEQQTLLYPLSASDEEAIMSAWRLWDNRYWVRVTPPVAEITPHVTICVRFLGPKDFASVRETSTPSQLQELGRRLATLVKGHVRFTLPVIVQRDASKSEEDRDVSEQIVAIPTLQWSVAGWRQENNEKTRDLWQWDIRYKYVSTMPNTSGSRVKE